MPHSAFTVSSAQCEKLKKHAKDTAESLSPITWLLKLFSINCNVDHETNCQTRYLVKYFLNMIIISTLNIFSLYYKITNVYKIINPSIRITDAIQCIYDMGQYMVDLWFVYKYGRHISVSYFGLYGSIDNIIGMSYFLEIKKKLMRGVVIFITIWLVSSVCDFFAWVTSYGYLIPTMYCVSYVYFLIKITTTLDLTSHVVHIEFRLKIIADIIEYYYTQTELLQGEISKSACFRDWLEDDSMKSKSRAHFLNKVSKEDHCQGAKLLRRCYLLLTDQVEFINRIFGFRILLNSLSLLIDMIRFTNIGVRILIGTQQTIYNSGYLPIIANMLRHITCGAILISLVHHCEIAYRGKERILKTIDHLLVHKKPEEKLDTALTELRQLIQDRPIAFNMSNFFTLNYGFLMSVASVYVTYTIILLQSS